MQSTAQTLQGGMSKAAFTKLLKQNQYICNDQFATLDQLKQAVVGATLHDYGGVFGEIKPGLKIKSSANHWLFSYIPFTNLTGKNSSEFDKMRQDASSAGFIGVVFLNNKGGPTGKAATAAALGFAAYYDDTYAATGRNGDDESVIASSYLDGTQRFLVENPEFPAPDVIAPGVTILSRADYASLFA